MPNNMGTIDRVVRAVLAVAIAILYFTGVISGTLAIVLGILALAFILTSIVGFCPLYYPFKLSTKSQ